MKKYNLIFLVLGLWACDGFLDEKPNKTIDSPTSFESLQAILDNSGTMNLHPALSLIVGGEYFSDDAGVMALPPWQQNLYLWKSQPFQIDDQVFDWRSMYNQIQHANVVLEEVEKLPSSDPRWNTIRGSALFFRAYAYFNIYSLFLDGPNLESQDLDTKIPIRNGTAITLSAEFAGKEEIINLIRSDLNEAELLLPSQAQYPFKPTKTAAQALKARVFLAWENYEEALQEAEKVLDSYSELIDYNSLDPRVTYPFPLFNKEVIWQSRLGGYSFMYSQTAFQVEPELYRLYDSLDLRKELFFVTRTNGFINFRGSYDGSITLFSGVTTAEIYLTLAETLVRTGDWLTGVDYLNQFLSNRYPSGISPLEFSAPEEALTRIIEERQKELAFRGIRWLDLRRLNKDPDFQVTLKRNFEGQEYKLEPESASYVLPIPPRELSFAN